MTERISLILITGLPGVGKTTAIKKLSAELVNKSIGVNGFYTEEVRDANNIRIGFDVISLDGKRDVLARPSETCDKSVKRPIVGKYSVYVESFEKVFIQSLSQKSDILIIDEIGKMELFSRRFENKIKDLLLEVRRSEVNIVATIPCRQSIKLIDEMKSLKNAKVFELTKQNRNNIYADIQKCCFDMLRI